MATPVQRATSIVDAVLNATATNAQKTRVADAFWDARLGAGTAGEKSAEFIRQIRQYVVDRVRQAESHSAATNAANAVMAQVDADFPEAP